MTNKIAKDGWSGLHLACSQGNIDIVKLFLTAEKVSVDLLSSERGTPLHVAARTGKIQIVSYLLLHKANIE